MIALLVTLPTALIVAIAATVRHRDWVWSLIAMWVVLLVSMWIFWSMRPKNPFGWLERRETEYVASGRR